MRFFRRRPKAEEFTIAVDRSGTVPRITITVSEKLAAGVVLQAAIREKGLEDPETLTLAHRYAVALSEAQETRQEATGLLEWLADVHEGDPEKRLPVLNDLSRVLNDAGDSTRSEEVNREALAGWERLRGRNDRNTLCAAHNLAIALLDLGQRDEAEGLLRHTVARRIRVLGATDPDTVASRNALAGTLRGTPKRLIEADRMYRAILADLADLPDRAEQAHNARHNLAAVLFHRNDLAAAEKTFREVLAERGKALGADHPDVLTARNSLATVLNARGRAAEAEKQFTEVVAARRRVLGRDHPSTLASQANLAAVKAGRGRVAEARPLLDDAITGLIAVHGPGHPMVQSLQQLRSQLF